jgi:hypothetical protein
LRDGMITVFDGIPDIFVERYDALFRQWGREYRKRGGHVAFGFDLMPDEAPMMDEEGRKVWAGAWLTAEIERVNEHKRMVIRPASDWDRHMIDVHCSKLRRWMLQ